MDGIVVIYPSPMVSLHTFSERDYVWCLVVKSGEITMYEFTGKVKVVGELQTFASGFSKRDLVVEEERDGRWPNVVAFSFKKDNAALLDGMSPGARVKVGFAVDGREWTDPKTGKLRYFSDLTALRLERLDGAVEVPEPAVPDNVTSERDDDPEIPF